MWVDSWIDTFKNLDQDSTSKFKNSNQETHEKPISRTWTDYQRHMNQIGRQTSNSNWLKRRIIANYRMKTTIKQVLPIRNKNKQQDIF